MLFFSLLPIDFTTSMNANKCKRKRALLFKVPTKSQDGKMLQSSDREKVSADTSICDLSEIAPISSTPKMNMPPPLAASTPLIPNLLIKKKAFIAKPSAKTKSPALVSSSKADAVNKQITLLPISNYETDSHIKSSVAKTKSSAFVSSAKAGTLKKQATVDNNKTDSHVKLSVASASDGANANHDRRNKISDGIDRVEKNVCTNENENISNDCKETNPIVRNAAKTIPITVSKSFQKQLKLFKNDVDRVESSSQSEISDASFDSTSMEPEQSYEISSAKESLMKLNKSKDQNGFKKPLTPKIKSSKVKRKMTVVIINKREKSQENCNSGKLIKNRKVQFSENTDENGSSNYPTKSRERELICKNMDEKSSSKSHNNELCRNVDEKSSSKSLIKEPIPQNMDAKISPKKATESGKNKNSARRNANNILQYLSAPKTPGTIEGEAELGEMVAFLAVAEEVCLCLVYA